MGQTGIAQLHIGAVIGDTIHFHGIVQLHCGGIVETDPVQPLRHPVARDDSRGGLHRLHLARQTVFVAVPADAPGAVAAHLAHAAVGIEKQHLVVAALGRGVHNHQTIGTDGQVPLAQRPGHLREALRREMFLQIIQHHKVVAGTVHFPEPHIAPPRMIVLFTYHIITAQDSS